MDDEVYVEADVDVSKTLTCGATYHYWRDGDIFETTLGGGFLRVRDTPDGFAYREEGVTEERVYRFLGMEEDLEEVRGAFPDDGPAERAFDRHRGLRLTRDDPFASVVSFVASAWNNNERTRGIVRRLCERHGGARSGWGARTFPSPETVAALGEDELREVGFGYRAPYVAETARAVADGEVKLDALRGEDRDGARTELKRLKGVGDKVADCVLLFSLGFVDTVALDTWLNRIVDALYPKVRGDGYEETARRFRDLFDGYAGYAQTYLYHDARTGGLDV